MTLRDLVISRLVADATWQRKIRMIVSGVVRRSKNIKTGFTETPSGIIPGGDWGQLLPLLAPMGAQRELFKRILAFGRGVWPKCRHLF